MALIKAGFDVVAGIDNDNSCRFGYEYNNEAKFIHKDILEVSAQEIDRLFGGKINNNKGAGWLRAVSTVFKIKLKTNRRKAIGTT